MDPKTIQTYDEQSSTIAARHKGVVPKRLYSLVETFFKKGADTLDLGCGIGRDTHWLNTNGFPAIGIDASEGMLTIAKKDYPQYTFTLGPLPDLNQSDESFDNIFCSAVLMHVPRANLVNSVLSILKVTKPNGRIILSYRSGQNEQDGRLFETYHPGQVAQLFESLGGKVLLIEQEGMWHNLVIEKGDSNKREGIQQIQSIISRDKKTATYKFALLRALCEISRYESHAVSWYREGDMVLVPMKRIAARWIYYYWPLIKNSIKQTTNEHLAFEEKLRDLPFEISEFQLLRHAVETESDEIKPLLKKISDTINKGPVKYAGGGDYSIFGFMSKLDASVYPELKDSEHGMVAVPLSIWRDLNLFSHWIEDSLSIQWAELTEKLNNDKNFAHHLDLITKSVQEDERSTYLIRKLFKGKEVECVWTGKKLNEFAVDHMIPWTLWRNNDLWNLLPADPKVNSKKRDHLPSPKIIQKRFYSIKGYWEIYQEEFPDLFERQLERGLGINLNEGFSKMGCEAIEQKLMKVRLTSGEGSWEP